MSCKLGQLEQGGGGGAAGAAGAAGQAQAASSSAFLQQLFDDMKQIEDTVDSIEIPARGRCKVFMAKYGYDPFKQSPNDNPDAELAFNAGDYIMVFDDIDEDGYFIGELMDGRRGFVPSNWLERLTGEHLFDFQATELYKHTKDDEGSESNSYPPEFYEAVLNDTMNHSNFQHLVAPEDYHRMNDYVDLDDVNEVDDECLSDYERAEAEQMRRAVPPPQRLTLERQLNKSILIGWLHPQAARGTIVSYQVYVDGVLKSTVPSGDRTKALLEGVDSNIPHRISVRAIDSSGRHSNDAGCTIVIGQNIPFAPSCVKASHITSDSALISWLPCNSNFHHVVAVNSVEVLTVRPGAYKHLINGLSANTLYRVWVRAKPGKILSIDEKNPKKLESLTTYVDFKTMPKSLPDPPVNVQVEAGPQRRTLLVTWFPLTLNDFGSSNGCPVTGYAVFAGHKKLADIDSPTGDHALLDLSDLESLHKKSVTVRTKSGENLSQDSMPCHIPDEYLKSTVGQKSSLDQLSHHHHTAQHQHQQRLSNESLMSRNSMMMNTAATRAGRSAHSVQRAYANSDTKLMHQQQYNQHQQQQHSPQRVGRHYANNVIRSGRSQLAKSLQNLESDLDSRRSSIPAIEITREQSGSDMINHLSESYSEEEFENSMRFKGVRGSGKPGSRVAGRYRSRQSHSVDSQRAGYNFASGGGPNSAASLTRIQQQQRAENQARANNELVRHFVALFDYDPSTMSPNPNAASEELAFKEGSIIRIFGDKGPDGFYRGELDNRVGFVPCNVVSEITDPSVIYSLQEKNNAALRQQSAAAYYNQPQQQPHQAPLQSQQQQQQQLPQQPPPRSANQQAQQPQAPQQAATLDGSAGQPQQNGVKRMTALYDYDPQENSPNADTESEIPFKVGDVIYVYGKMDTDGFYMGEVERTKQRGLVPSNFLREEPLLAANKQLQQANQMGPMFNQVEPAAFQQQQQQQQRVQNPSQFVAGAVQGQQQQQLNQLNQMNQLRNNGQMLGLGAANKALLMGAQSAAAGQLQFAAQAQQQNINRPTTLSLSAMSNSAGQLGNLNDWNSGANATRAQLINAAQQMQQPGGLQQQQQQQQMLQNRTMDNAMTMGMNPMSNQYGAGPLNTMQQQQQQQQQRQPTNNQPSSGVLSNLLSSGKQIIGAATTPRAPNQPGAMQLGSGVGAGNMAMGGLNVMDGGANFQLNRAANMQNLGMLPNEASMQAQFHSAPNMMSMTANQMHSMAPAQQHQQQQQQQQHHQQQQQFNQMGGANRPNLINQANAGAMSGDELGGNILNTVKNMFKL